jgi:hypothetical protein
MKTDPGGTHDDMGITWMACGDGTGSMRTTPPLVRVEEEDWVDEDEAAVGDGGGDQNQVPKEAIVFGISARARRRNQG